MYKIIYPEKITAVSSSSEDIQFLASNLLDDKPKKVWKAESGTNSATITISVSAGVKALGIFNTNATSATVNGTISLASLTENRIWYEFADTLSASDITITLACGTGTTIYAGVIVAGALTTLSVPGIDISEESIDYSVVTQLSSGSEHVRKGEICRQFTASHWLTRDTQWKNLWNLYYVNGQMPLGMLLAEINDNHRWCGFFKLFPIKANHGAPTKSLSTFIIKEVI